MTATAFPDGFRWGAATSAFQVEGSPLADGAGPSNWLRFTHVPGNIETGENADHACDHYRRYPEDVALMRELGLGGYRFSISWSRILPEGRGRVNRAGLDHYARVVDTLLDHGIEPNVTLFHWDLPAALEDLGGWLHPDSPSWFADYAHAVFLALGDRVPMWATINEPWVIVDGGYLHDDHPPGRCSPRDTAVAAHHLVCAHGAAVQVYRSVARQRIGLVVNLEPKDPATPSADDVQAAHRSHLYMNRQFLDPVLLGHTPEGLAELYGEDWPHRGEPDLARAHPPIDFLGINYYKRGVMRRDDSRPVERAAHVHPPGRPYTELNWEVFAEGLTRTLVWVKDSYGDIPLYVTENGAAFADPDTATTSPVDDPSRVEYLREHLVAARRAIELGVDLRGYYVWSLLDNFEWAHGFSKRFGIVHVDHQRQTRTLKRSALFYRDFVRPNGASGRGV